MNNQPKISVIVPVYNTEKYLSKCLDSILNQTLRDIEVIIVNDGSTDNSQQIIDDFAKRDTRISFIMKKNGGLSDARNVGIEASIGMFL
ncbi:MAG: glycosyltransferase, partial [Algoriella sp.]